MALVQRDDRRCGESLGGTDASVVALAIPLLLEQLLHVASRAGVAAAPPRGESKRAAAARLEAPAHLERLASDLGHGDTSASRLAVDGLREIVRQRFIHAYRHHIGQ
jgi:hypothetical protein